MNKPIKDLKAISRGQLIGKYSTCIAATIFISLIESVCLLITSGSGGNTLGTYLIGLLISIIVDLLLGILSYGENYFFLQVARCNMPLNISDLFIGFKRNMDKAILLQAPLTVVALIPALIVACIDFGMITVSEENYLLVLFLLEFLASLLIFIAKLFIGLNYYILCDNPELSVQEIFAKSISLMKNQKGRLILTYLSLIPLLLLCVISIVGLLWFGVYLRTILANFYIDVIGEKPHSPYTTDPKDVNHVDYSI